MIPTASRPPVTFLFILFLFGMASTSAALPFAQSSSSCVTGNREISADSLKIREAGQVYFLMHWFLI
jgi:hypothetical protein